MIKDSLLRFQKEQKYLIFDTETCNLNLVSQDNLPWEFAWWIVTLDNVIAKRTCLLKWDNIRVGDVAARMTGYYTRDFSTAEKPEDVLAEFDALYYDPQYIPVAHNGLGFDVYIHKTFRTVLGKKADYSPLERFIDTNLYAKAMKLGIEIPEEDRLSFQYKLKSFRQRGLKTSVQALCTEWGYEYDLEQAHNADYDNGRLYLILQKLIKTIEI